MTTAGRVLVDLLAYAIEAAPELGKTLPDVVCAFWKCHEADLGPIPTDLRSQVRSIDRRVDNILDDLDELQSRR